MKKILVLLAMAISLTSFAQKRHMYYGFAPSGFMTNFGESGLNLDVSAYKASPHWFPSLNFDVYTSHRVVADYYATTAQIGVLVNIPVACGLLVSTGPKWVTQGFEIKGYNEIAAHVGVTYLSFLGERKDGVLYFKVSGQYTSGTDERVYGMMGLQFILK